MVDKTMSAVITDIEREIYQVAGVGTQVYAQDIIAGRVNAAFLTFFDDKNITWKRYLEYTTYVLNGTTGRMTVDVSATYKEYHDVIKVFPLTSDRALTYWNPQRNPTLITGDTPLFITADSTNVFRVLPFVATGSVVVFGKNRPDNYPFDIDQTVEFDALAITYYVAMQMMIDDGSNPGAAEKFKALFDNRYKQLDIGQTKEDIALNGTGGFIPDSWFDPNA